MWCAADNHNYYVSHKEFQIRTLIKQLLTVYHFFTKLPQISHFHKNRNCLSIMGTF